MENYRNLTRISGAREVTSVLAKCEEEPSDNKNTGQNKETDNCFLTVAMAMKLGRL